MNVVVRGQEVTDLDGTPRALQANERFTRAEQTAARIRADVGFDLENCRQTAAERFAAANAQTRRVGADAIDRAIDCTRSCWKVGVDGTATHGLHGQIQATVQRHVRGLRLRGQRGGKQTRDCDSDELLIHGISPLTDKIGKVCCLLRLPLGTFSNRYEKLHPIVPNRGKHWQAEGKMGSMAKDACCAEATENGVSGVYQRGWRTHARHRQPPPRFFNNTMNIIQKTMKLRSAAQVATGSPFFQHFQGVPMIFGGFQVQQTGKIEQGTRKTWFRA